jgi:hypothetical protein
MNKLMTLIKNLVILLLVVLVVRWSWQKFNEGDSSETDLSRIPESDRICRIVNADTGACVCYHRQTEVRLALSHDECLSRALKSR